MTCNCNICLNSHYPHTTLEDFRRSTCVDPYTFWGWSSDKLKQPKKGACYSIVRQSASSNGCDAGTLGRDNILDALRLSEQTFRDYLGPVVPEWHQEIIDAKKWGCSQSWRNSRKVVLSNKNVSAVGKLVRSTLATVDKGTPEYLIEAKRGSVLDTFTLTLTGIATDVAADEIKVYVSTGERTKEADNWRRWQMATESITLSAGTLTITGHAYLLGKPELYERYEPLAKPLSAYGDYSLNPDNLDCYIEQLEIVRETIDRCDGSQAIRRNHCGCPTCKPDGSTCEVCENISFCVIDKAVGIIEPIRNGCYVPDKYCVNYYSEGLSCNRDWTRDIGILAIAYMCQPICGCELGCLAQWYADFANEDSKKRTTMTQIENPLGSRSGMLHAWNLIKRYRASGGMLW